MGTYYYLKDPKNEEGTTTAVYEDDMIVALYAIAKKHGLEITNQMILDQIQKKDSKHPDRKKTYLYIDGTNLFAGQHELLGPNKHLSFSFLIQEIKKLISVDKIFFLRLLYEPEK